MQNAALWFSDDKKRGMQRAVSSGMCWSAPFEIASPATYRFVRPRQPRKNYQWSRRAFLWSGFSTKKAVAVSPKVQLGACLCQPSSG